MATKLSFKDWIKLSSMQRKAIYDSWDKYKGEGEEIVREAFRLFEKTFRGPRDVVSLSYGVYHGGDWVISITLRVGYEIDLPKDFYGFTVIKLFSGLSTRLERNLVHKYHDDIEKFITGEMTEFRKCFTFLESPHAKGWLVKFVKKYRDSGSL